ncbi:reverse transcriptase domain-containing protein, partial [Tanacetum coccineum]
MFSSPILRSKEGNIYRHVLRLTTYALRFEFETINNKAEYEALLVCLQIAVDIKIKDLAIFVDSQLVANQVKGLFEARQPVIKKYLEKTKEVLGSFDSLSKLASMAFARLAKEVLIEVLIERLIVQREVSDIIKEEGENWMFPIREYILFGL